MNIRDLDLNLLFVFEAIYSTNNISHAAERLDISQPAMSNALARLRKRIDDPLFVRNGNGVIPTSRAEAMIDPVRTALSAIRQSIDPVDSFDPQTSSRKFKLIVADPVEHIVMPGLLRDTAQNPDVRYELLPPQSTNIEEALLLDKIDLAVFLMPAHNAEIVCQPLCPLDLVVIARIGHPRIDGVISAQNFLQERGVSLSIAPGRLANSEKLTFWQKVQQNTVCHVPRVSSMPPIVANSDLIGVIPRRYAEEVAPRFNLQVINTPVQLSNQQFQLIWHKRNQVDPGLVWLREKIAACFAQEEA